MNILLFGITKSIVGAKYLTVEQPLGNVADLKSYLENKYPAFGELNALAVAVNNQYAEDITSLNPNDEIALIPPVSGG